jgi:hypothetical protein
VVWREGNSGNDLGTAALLDDQTELDHPAEIVLPASIGAHLRQAVGSAAKTAYDGALVARDALAAALAEQSEIGTAQAELQGRIDAAHKASADVAAAEERLRGFLFENALAEKPDVAKQGELARAVRDARQRAKPSDDDRARLAELYTSGLAIGRRIAQHQRDVILAEAANLADAYHHHERLALKAQAAIEGLARAALATAEQHRDHRGANELKPGEVRDHTAAQPFVDLALQLRRSLDYGPDSQASAAGRAARIDAAERFGREVGGWVAALNADPFAAVPDLEA